MVTDIIIVEVNFIGLSRPNQGTPTATRKDRFAQALSADPGCPVAPEPYSLFAAAYYLSLQPATVESLPLSVSSIFELSQPPPIALHASSLVFAAYSPPAV